MQCISTEEGMVARLLLLREGLRTKYQYAGRGGRLMY